MKKIFLTTLSILCIAIGMFLTQVSAQEVNTEMVRFDNSESIGTPDKNWHFNGSDDFAVQFHVAGGSFSGGCVYISLPFGNEDGIYAGGLPSWNLPVKLYQWQTNVFETKKNSPIAEAVIAVTKGNSLYEFSFGQVFQEGEYLVEISVPESVNWYADVLFNQAAGLNEAVSDKVQYYRGMNKVDTKYVFGLLGSELSFGTVSEQSNAPAGRDFFAGGNKNNDFGSPFVEAIGAGNWGIQFNTTGKFVSAGMYIYSPNENSVVNAKLYKWAYNYAVTVASAPVEDITLQCAADGWKTFQFSKEYEAGEYLLVVSGTGFVTVAGEDKVDGTKVACYKNGEPAAKTSIGYIAMSSAAGELITVSASVENPGTVRFDNSESIGTPDKNWHFNGSDDFAVQFHVAGGSFSGGCVYISLPFGNEDGIYAGGLPSWNLPVKLYQLQTNIFETKKNGPIAEAVIAVTKGNSLYEFSFGQIFQEGEYLVEISVPESVNWYADVLFNQAAGLNEAVSDKVQYYRGMNKVDTKYVFGLLGSELSFGMVSEQSNAPAGRDFFTGGNKNNDFGSPFVEAIGAGNWGVQFNTTGKFISAGMYIYSPNENSVVNAKLYKWAYNYAVTVASAPVEDITLQCAADGWKKFQFSKEYEAGEYLLVVSGTGFTTVAGEDKVDGTKVVCYKNGEPAAKTSIGYITISSAAGKLIPISASSENPGTGESGSYALFIMVSLIICTLIFFRKKLYNNIL